MFCDNCGTTLPVKCLQCGEPNPRGATYCESCGASLVDIRAATQNAIVTGSGAIASTGVTIGTEGITVGKDVLGRDVIVSYGTAFERVVGSTVSVLNQLELNYKQTREQAQGWFRFSLLAAGTGFVLIGIGVVAVALGYTTAGIITAISSAVPNAAAALFFVQSKKADERVDTITTRLTEARELYTLVEIANTISDIKSQDKLKAEIVRKALRFDKKSDADK